MKISFGLLPDHPMSEILDTIEVADGSGFHAVLRRRRDVPQGLLPDLRGRGGADEEHHPRARRHPRDPARPDDGRAGDGDARRADRRPHRAELLDRQLRDARAVRRCRTRREALAVPHARGARDDADVPGRGRARPRGRVLHLQGHVHVGAAGAGADADQDRRDARARSRSSSPARSPTGCTRRSATPARRTSTPPTTSGSAPSGPGRDWDDARHRRVGRRRAWPRTATAARECVRGAGRVLHPGDADRAGRSATASTSRRRSRSSTRSRAATSSKAIELTTPDLVEKLSFSGTPEDVVEQIKDERRPGRDEPRHPLALRSHPGAALAGPRGHYGGVPHMKDQLQLIHDRVMPQLASS